MRYALISPSGLPLQLLETSAEVLPPGAVALPSGVPLELLARQMLVDGAWVPRPAIVLTMTQDASGAHVVLAEGPAAVTATIRDIEAAEDLLSAEVAPGATWSLPDPGRYAIEAEGPEPWLPANLRIDVSA